MKIELTFKTKYRVVTDHYSGYCAQGKVWWWPFWVELNGCNTHRTIELAKAQIDKCKFLTEVVYETND